MIEAGSLIAIAVGLTAAGSSLWRRIANSGPYRLDRILQVGLAVVLVEGGASYVLMNSRDVQIVGSIVPRVETPRPIVALSFDDGPMPPYTDELLRVLAEKDVRATFFVTGRQLEQFPAFGEALVRAGHELGNHSYSHQRLVFKDYGFVRSELERTDLLIRKAGYTGTIHFRSPYAKKLFVLPLYLWRAGKTNVLADVEPDAQPRASAEMVETTLAGVEPGSIVILHAENPLRLESLRAVPQIIDALVQRGYRFVTVSELLESAPAS